MEKYFVKSVGTLNVIAVEYIVKIVLNFLTGLKQYYIIFYK